MSKIGILGKMASGKTTLANYILNIDDEYQIYSFGDKVKSVAKDLFSMTGKNRELLQSIGEKMKLRYLAKTIIFFTLHLTMSACSEKNWPELSPLSEFENNFFLDQRDENRIP